MRKYVNKEKKNKGDCVRAASTLIALPAINFYLCASETVTENNIMNDNEMHFYTIPL